MRTRTVMICLLAALCLVRALAFPDGGGRSGAGPPEGSAGPWRGVTGGRSPDAVGRTEGTPVTARGTDVWPSCGGRSPPCDRVRPPRDAWSAVVRRVVDGDTVILLVRGRSIRVRLIGADAPEIWSRRDCYGAEAARALRALLPPGSPVRAAGDRDAADRYGRRLLYLWTLGHRPHTGTTAPRADPWAAHAGPRAGRAVPWSVHAGPKAGRAVPGTVSAGPRAARTQTFVAAWLIGAGLARAMYVPPNGRYAAVMRMAEGAARRSRAGLWSACAGR